MPQSSKVNVEYKVAHPEDAEQLFDVFYYTWLDTYPNEHDGVTVKDVKQMYLHKQTIIDRNRIRLREFRLQGQVKAFIAKVDGIIVGCCYVELGNEHLLNKMRALYVLPQYHHMGIGKTLFTKGMKWLASKNNYPTYLIVAKFNPHAIKFYELNGFVHTNIEDKFEVIPGKFLQTIRMLHN